MKTMRSVTIRMSNLAVVEFLIGQSGILMSFLLKLLAMCFKRFKDKVDVLSGYNLYGS